MWKCNSSWLGGLACKLYGWHIVGKQNEKPEKYVLGFCPLKPGKYWNGMNPENYEDEF